MIHPRVVGSNDCKGTQQSKDLDTLISCSVLSAQALQVGRLSPGVCFSLLPSQNGTKLSCPSRVTHRLLGDSWKAGEFGAIWFRQQKWRSNSSINFRKIQKLTTEISIYMQLLWLGCFQVRGGWCRMLCRSQHRGHVRVSSPFPWKGAEIPHFSFLWLTLMWGCRQQSFQPVPGTERKKEGSWSKWVFVPFCAFLIWQIKSNEYMRVWSKTANCQLSLNYYHFIIFWNKAAFL